VCAGAVRVSVNDNGPHPTVKVTGLWWPWFARARAKRFVQSDRYPWLCQRCANVGLCFRCGSPYDRAPGADILDDDGTILHVPLVAGMGRRCGRCEGQADGQPPRSA
jgi:hypothetical protein